MSNPKVTILMPAYNASKYIAEAIRSVLNQTFINFELLIINDGSTDNTEKVVQSFSDKRIRLINQQNGGVSAALNTGLKEAQGDFIARFDADDFCYPNRLQKQYDFIIQNPDYILVGSDADYMTEEGEHIYTYYNVGHTDEEIRKTIIKHCSFIHSSVIYPKKAVIDLGGYEDKAHTFEDYFLWKQLIQHGKVCNIKEPLIKVRFNPSSITIDEKDQDIEFKQLKAEALKTGKISERESLRIINALKRISLVKKEASYHRMLGKKFLWDNYQPSRSRKHVLESVKKEPFKLSSYILLIISFLPEKALKKIYTRIKSQ